MRPVFLALGLPEPQPLRGHIQPQRQGADLVLAPFAGASAPQDGGGEAAVDAELRAAWQELLDNLAPYPMGKDPQSRALTGGVLADDGWAAGHRGEGDGQTQGSRRGKEKEGGGAFRVLP